MFVLGLTGSIAMGKTWGAKCFRHFGVPVHDADACVHDLLGPGGEAVTMVAAAFPGVMAAHGGIDRLKLSNLVFNDAAALDKLEAMLHPLVQQSQRCFLAAQACRRAVLVVLDVPLLYETQGRAKVDAAVVMSAPKFLQRRRVLKRSGMSEQKLNAIVARQMPDEIKRRVAEYVVMTNGPRGQSLREIAAIVKKTRTLRGQAWNPGWGR
ncbi:MAG: dephospho-CoA kinase [Rhodospirillales bacterium]|nr:dephospho-CoA kinase [Rhodospirillales bacterium]